MHKVVDRFDFFDFIGGIQEAQARQVDVPLLKVVGIETKLNSPFQQADQVTAVNLAFIRKQSHHIEETFLDRICLFLRQASHADQGLVVMNK